MTRWQVLACSTAGGLLFIYWLFPRYDISGRDWKTAMNRDSTKRAVSDLARSHGINIDGWRMWIDATWNSRMSEARHNPLTADILANLSPLAIQARAEKGDAQSRLDVSFFADGRPASYAVTPVQGTPANIEAEFN